MSDLKIGDKVFYVEASTRYGKEVPCSVCFGKRYATIILGDGSSSEIECGFCSHGFAGPSGFCKAWEPFAKVLEGEIEGISTRNGLRYEVGYSAFTRDEIYLKKDDAEKQCKIQYKILKERAEKWFEESFVSCKKKQLWSLGYHKNQIKDHERTIKWHKLRLRMISEKMDSKPKGKAERCIEIVEEIE